jgi:uncharacterized damage-inducible protein DinB
MNGLVLRDAFAHHVWATVRLIDACGALDPEQLETTSPGTYGSIRDTLRHLVGADASYLFVLTRGDVLQIDEDAMGLDKLRAVMERNGSGWSAFLERDLDPDAILVRPRDDGSESHAPAGIRIAQALHHGTDHRSQICTTLTTLGIEPPEIDVWAFAEQDGRLSEIVPAS